MTIQPFPRQNKGFNWLILFAFVIGGSVLVTGCAKLPFGQNPTIKSVDTETLLSKDAQHWYDVHRYKSGYWYRYADEGTYLLVSMGKQNEDYSIQASHLAKDRSDRLKLDLSIDKKTDNDTEGKPVYPHKLYLLQPHIDDYELIIREHQRGTIKSLRQANRSLKEKNQTLNKQVKDLRSAVKFLRNQLADSTARVNRQAEQIETLRRNRVKLAQQQSDLQKRNRKLEENVKTLKANLNNLNEQFKKTAEENKKLKEKIESSSSPNSPPKQSLYFDVGQYELNKKQKTKLLDTFRNLSDIESISLSLIGFSDTMPVDGEEMKSNLYLSTMRTWSVSKFLIDQTELKERNLLLVGAGAPADYPKHADHQTFRRVDIHTMNGKPIRIR